MLAIGGGLATGCILDAFEPDGAIRAWQPTLLDFSALRAGRALRIDATFLIGALIPLAVFAIQRRGALRAARFRTIVGPVVVAPLLAGDATATNSFPLEPLAFTKDGEVTAGRWDVPGRALSLGGRFIAARSACTFETTICHACGFHDPASDMPKAIPAGLLCIVVHMLVHPSFWGAPSAEGMPREGAVDGSAVAGMVAGGPLVFAPVVVIARVFHP